MTRRATRPGGYDPAAFPPVAVTVDMVVLTIVDDDLQVVLVERGSEPFKGEWALPGGFIRPDETLDDAASRELREETQVRAAKHLEQFGAYGDPERDPRMRIVTSRVSCDSTAPRSRGCRYRCCTRSARPRTQRTRTTTDPPIGV